MVKDRIGRPIHAGDVVSIRSTRETGKVVGKTIGRRTMVDVRMSNGKVVSFYGTSVML